MKIPKIGIEPGRSIIGNAGSTLYTVVSIKEIIRPALYDAEYECVVTGKVKSEFMERVSGAGNCCEFGDILLNGIEIPKTEGGDVKVICRRQNFDQILENEVLL